MLNLAWKKENRALQVLEKMVRITMMRGAQSGGVVTYADDGDANKTIGLRGIRSRVCNGKRTDLSKLVRNATQSNESRAKRSKRQVPLYAGHTRFATSSIASLPGTHPHQWTPPRQLPVYDKGQRAVPSSASSTNVETFICHNGDLEFYKIGGSWYETGDVQEWLERVTETPMPAAVDSAAIAGIMDIQRCQGCWPLAVRFGYLFAMNHTGLHYEVPKFDVFRRVAKVFDKAFQDVLRSFPADVMAAGMEEEAFHTLQNHIYDSSVTPSDIDASTNADASVVGGTAKKSPSAVRRASIESNASNGGRGGGPPKLTRAETRKITDPLFYSGSRPGEKLTWWQMVSIKRKEIKLAALRAFAATPEQGVFGMDVEGGLDEFVEAVIGAFFDNDLFHSVRRFLSSARGSFGLGITCSLDAGRQMVVAARGQTISVAFYPKLGLVLYGSEQAGTYSTHCLRIVFIPHFAFRIPFIRSNHTGASLRCF